MSIDYFPSRQEIDVCYPHFQVSLTLLSTAQIKYEIKKEPFARIEGGKLAEHWDVLQNEAPAAADASTKEALDPHEGSHPA